MSKPTLYLGRADQGTPLSREEFAEAQYEEPWRYERVEGRLVVMTPSGHEHSIVGNKIRSYLGAYEVEHPEIVACVISEAWIAVDDDTDRIADIAVYLAASSPADRIPERIPDLVFEVVSEGSEAKRRDYEEKRAEYERIGVQEYVVIDRFEHRVTIFRRSESRLNETMLSANATYTTPLLPGLEIPLESVV
jgi:Uma2 family endonuclease